MAPTQQELLRNPHLAQNLSTVWPTFKYTDYAGDADLNASSTPSCKLFRSEDEFEDYCDRHPDAQWFNNPGLKEEIPVSATVAGDSDLSERLSSLEQAYTAAVAQNEALKRANADGAKENTRLNAACVKLQHEVEDLGKQLDEAETAFAEVTTAKTETVKVEAPKPATTPKTSK